MVNRLVRKLEQQQRDEARVQREVGASISRMICRLERQHAEDGQAAMWRCVEPDVALVMRALIRNVEESCEDDARARREHERIEREVAAVMRRVVSRVEHTSEAFEKVKRGAEDHATYGHVAPSPLNGLSISRRLLHFTPSSSSSLPPSSSALAHRRSGASSTSGSNSQSWMRIL